MADTDLMDRALALVKAVPELHHQPKLSTAVYDEQAQDRAAAKIRAAAESRVAEAVLIDGCGTAHCYAGWVLILGGYRFVYGGPFETGFYERDGQGDRVVREIDAAATLLGIPFEEAYDFTTGSGLFWDHNTIPMIEAWVDYYKGQIDQVELFSRLEMEKANAGH